MDFGLVCVFCMFWYVVYGCLTDRIDECCVFYVFVVAVLQMLDDFSDFHVVLDTRRCRAFFECIPLLLSFLFSRFKLDKDFGYQGVVVSGCESRRV